MTTNHGAFVWYELMTPDSAAAATFYSAVVGWKAVEAGPPHAGYTMFHAGDAMVGGMMQTPEALRSAGVPPHWTGYIAVEDVGDYAVRVQAAGGTVHRPASDIPQVGRFAVVADPQGATFVLFQPSAGSQPMPATPGTPGHIGWRELHAADWEPAFAFYAGLFGWTKANAVDMGPMGTYQLFAKDGADLGGMMSRMDPAQRPGWLYYFSVAAIDAAAERVKAAGGTVLQGPHEVPGGLWIVQCRDPQGAMFALVSQAR